MSKCDTNDNMNCATEYIHTPVCISTDWNLNLSHWDLFLTTFYFHFSVHLFLHIQIKKKKRKEKHTMKLIKAPILHFARYLILLRRKCVYDEITTR